MSDCGCHIEAKNAEDRKTLRILLLVNEGMFVVGLMAGVLAHSTALIADSLDMFADAFVYAISLYAVGKSSYYKNRAAILSGIGSSDLSVKRVSIDTLFTPPTSLIG